MNSIPYDLHIHSCLSPCADQDMTPANIVGMAHLAGLEIIAITDHNSAKNCPAALFHGEQYGITVIPGMELTTSEEVHVICLFPTLKDAMDFDQYVDQHLPAIENKPTIFGDQLVRNEKDEVIDIVKKLLINATDISIDSLDTLLPIYNGLWFPSHIDKKTTSILSNLGFIAPTHSFDIVEISDLSQWGSLKTANPYLEKCKVVSNSDAHYLHEIKKR